MKKTRKIILLLLLAFFFLQIIGIAIYVSVENDNTVFAYLFFAFTIVELFLILMVFWINDRADIVQLKYKKNINAIIHKKIYEVGMIGFVAYDENYNVISINDYLNNLFKTSYIGKSAQYLVPNIKNIHKTCQLRLSIENYLFEVHVIYEANILILKNETYFDINTKKYNDELLSVGIINIDNYNSVINAANEQRRFQLNENIVSILIKWGLEDNIFIKSFSNEQFLILTNKKNMNHQFKSQKLKNLVSVLTENAKKLDANINFSIGIAYGLNNPKILYDTALENINISLSRGGDQAILTDFSENNNYFVSSDKIGESNKSRIKLHNYASQIEQQIKKAENIIISGHHWADYDSIGSALGIYYFVSLFNPNVKILIDIKALSIDTRKWILREVPSKLWNEIYLDPYRVENYIKRNSLLLIVDTSIKERLELPNYLKTITNFSIIDHHRVQNKEIENFVNHYIDAYASSTSEIVGEILSYYSNLLKQKPIPHFICNFMLAGIMVDTNFFRSKTSEKTFLIASLLREWGADEVTVNDMLKKDKKIVYETNQLLANANKYYSDIYITLGDEKSRYDKSLLAMTAQEMISITDCNVSFVIAKSKNNHTSISCRSIGNNFNVQEVAERLGGGGHFNAAAAESKNLSVRQMNSKLLKILKKINSKNKNER